ncbi:hypothetical protein DL95DRAFT_452838 [Leptodontidium sp. 2 PMI_412]|nr:hypothetical protein BKA61DRAFT_668068 [Leptodontidium sp. MPI-SDFR-AT-0119]KAH9223855.1 hypothetical protein DL95DRAFT_452838 [Leptodontidium sp. 2 PMI_412]
MRLQLPTILTILPLILAAPIADHLAADLPTPTLPTPGEISILPIPIPNPATAPPSPSPPATLQDLLAFCASGSPADDLPG